MLHRGKTNKIQKITSGEALPLILPQTLFYGDEEETNLLLSFLDRFLQSVPVYKMECTMEEEAAKTAYFCMKGEEKKIKIKRRFFASQGGRRSCCSSGR